jgi:hypothetical protein
MYGVLAGFTTFCIRHQIWVGGGGGRQSLTTTRHTRGVNVSTKQSPAVHESAFTFPPMTGGIPLSHKVLIYLEYHSVCPIDRIGTPPPIPSPASECVSPGTKGGGGTLSCGCGVGVPVRSTGKKPSTVSTLCFEPFLEGAGGQFTLPWRNPSWVS